MAKMHRVNSVIEPPKQDYYWLNIGAAFPHENGDGFSVILLALPLLGNGKLVVRAYDPETHEAEEAEKQAVVEKGAKVPA